MTDAIKLFISELRTLWGRIGLNQKVALGTLITALVAALFFWGSWNSRDDFGLLFKNLQQKDAAEIINALRAEGVAYRVAEDGTAVLVPSEHVYDLRLKLAGQGLPGQEEGWSLFDQTRLGGLSDFVQKINYTRALQAELERTISRLRQVEWARVHIVEAKDSLFADKTEAATASVLLKTRASAQLSEDQLAGITHLISGAVRGLTPENVTVTDYSGRQLSARGGSDVVSRASSQLNYRRRLEEHLAGRAAQMLERVLGPGKAIVTVSAEIDFSSSESHEILYTEDITKSKTETIKEMAAAPAGAGAPGSSTREEKTEYMTPLPSSETKRKEPGGTIKRLAAAVFVSAGEYKTTSGSDGEQTRKYMPAAKAKLAEYEQIVKNAIGFKEERLDSITIYDGEFRSSSPISSEELTVIETQNTRQFIVGLVKSGSPALGVLLFLIFARRALKKTFAQKAASMAAPQTFATDTVTHQPEPEPQRTATVELKEKVAGTINEAPDNATQYLRAWMNK